MPGLGPRRRGESVQMENFVDSALAGAERRLNCCPQSRGPWPEKQPTSVSNLVLLPHHRGQPHSLAALSHFSTVGRGSPSLYCSSGYSLNPTPWPLSNKTAAGCRSIHLRGASGTNPKGCKSS